MVTEREGRLGLEENIATSCVTDELPACDERLCFFFEDYSEVSPHFFHWTLKQLVAGPIPSSSPLMCIALHGVQVDQYTHRRYFNDHAHAKNQLNFTPKANQNINK